MDPSIGYIFSWKASNVVNEGSAILTYLTMQKLENYQTPIIMHHNLLNIFSGVIHTFVGTKLKNLTDSFQTFRYLVVLF